MSDKKSLLIGFAGTGKTVQKTLTNIKQDAPPIALKAFAEKLGTLSNDTVNSIAVVERTEIVNPPKLARTLTLSKSTMNVNSERESCPITITLTYDGDGTAVLSGKKFVSVDVAVDGKTVVITDNVESIMQWNTEFGSTAEKGTMIITVPETDIYASASAEFQFTGGATGTMRDI